jgi:hypothetical protein
MDRVRSDCTLEGDSSTQQGTLEEEEEEEEKNPRLGGDVLNPAKFEFLPESRSVAYLLRTVPHSHRQLERLTCSAVGSPDRKHMLIRCRLCNDHHQSG